jgi:hypothetical protein
MMYNRRFKENLDYILEKNKSKLDLSSVDFDGSNTFQQSEVAKKQNIKAERSVKQQIYCI